MKWISVEERRPLPEPSTTGGGSEVELIKKCPWCGGELFRVYGAMNYPWDYSCSKCNGYCFERDVLRANKQMEFNREKINRC